MIAEISVTKNFNTINGYNTSLFHRTIQESFGSIYIYIKYMDKESLASSRKGVDI